MKNALIQIEVAIDDIIAGNLYSQLLWLVGTDYQNALGI